MTIDTDKARDILQRCGIDRVTDFHALPSRQVEELVMWAKVTCYRKPTNANGSTARYFHAHLMRKAKRES